MSPNTPGGTATPSLFRDRTRPQAVGRHEPEHDPGAPRAGQLAELKRRRRFLHRFPHRPTLPLTRAWDQRIH